MAGWDDLATFGLRLGPCTRHDGRAGKREPSGRGSLDWRGSLAASIPPASEREPPDSPHVLAVSECEDRLEVQTRVVRRHFWRRLLPGVGVMSYMGVSTALGLGTPFLVMTVVFGLFTAREALTFRKNLAGLRALESELALLTGRAPGFGQTSRERPQGSA